MEVGRSSATGSLTYAVEWVARHGDFLNEIESDIWARYQSWLLYANHKYCNRYLLTHGRTYIHPIMLWVMVV